MTTEYELRSSGGGYDHLLSDDLSGDGGVSEAVTQQRAGKTLSDQHIRFERVAKRYVTKKGTVTALDDISLTIGRGEIFGVIGRSGAGKSTLIRTINRLESIDDGSVTINDVNVRQLRGNGLVALRRRIGMIFQHFNLLHSRTVYQNLALPARAAGLDNTEIKRRAERLLSLVGLAGKEAVYPSRLSGGQKQRVGIARALMLDPDILLCDEATSALDPETTATILALLRDINRQLGLTIVLITHEMAVIRDICDRVAVLDQGQLIESGSVGQVFSAPRHQLTRSLLAPLAVRLPVELAERVVDHADPQHTTTLVRLDVGGEHDALGGLDLAGLSALLGAEATLLHGGIERLQGRVHGRFFLGVAALEPARIEQQLDQQGITAEVVGYV